MLCSTLPWWTWLRCTAVDWGKFCHKIASSWGQWIRAYIYTSNMGTYEFASRYKQNASYTHFSVSFARLDNECYSPDEHVRCSACGRLAGVLENLRSGAPCKDQQGSGWSRVGLSWCPPDSGPRSDRGIFLELEVGVTDRVCWTYGEALCSVESGLEC